MRLIDIASGAQRPVAPDDAISFAPRFSPDGTRIVFSMMIGANCDIYITGARRRRSAAADHRAGIDTDPSFSPDGTKIVFESDRGGSQQLYVMNADGSNQRRMSFGGGWYASPDWSPDGEWIAFTRRGSGRTADRDHQCRRQRARNADDRADGRGPELGGEQPRADLPADRRHGPNRALPDFARRQRSAQMSIPQGGSDPDWSGVMD